MIQSAIPRTWTRAALSDVATVVQGQSPPGVTYNTLGTGVPFLQGCGEFGALTPRPTKWCSEPVRLAEAGDILISIRAPVGPTNVADQRYCIGRGLAAIRASQTIEPSFLLYQLRLAVSALVRRSTGTTFDAIGGSVLREHEVAIAPLPEQRRVVEAIDSYLTRLDDAVASLERAEAKLKAYRASVLKAAVEGRLVPTEDALARAEKRDYESGEALLARILKERRRRWEEAELARLKASGNPPKDDKWKAKYKKAAPPDLADAQPLPEGWSWASAEQVGDILLGRQRSQTYLTGRWSRPYLRVANVKDDRIDLDDVEQMDFDPVHYQRYRLQAGDILVSEGQSPHLVGQSAIYRGGIDGLCFQKTLHRFRPVPGGPCSKFAQVVFRANVRLGVYKKVAPITTNIAHLTLEKFQASRFPLPPAAEQERIVSEVERLFSVAAAVEQEANQELARLGRLRQCILKWAFEGKLVDQDPADEPAEKLLARIRAERAATVPTKKARSRVAKGAA